MRAGCGQSCAIQPWFLIWENIQKLNFNHIVLFHDEYLSTSLWHWCSVGTPSTWKMASFPEKPSSRGGVLEHKYDGTWRRPSSHMFRCGYGPLGGSSVLFSLQGGKALEWVIGWPNTELEGLAAPACARTLSTGGTWSLVSLCTQNTETQAEQQVDGHSLPTLGGGAGHSCSILGLSKGHLWWVQPRDT